jgi:hypothetical protein
MYHSLAYITWFMSNDCWESWYCSVLEGEVFCGAVEALRVVNNTTFMDLYLNNRFYALCLYARLPLPAFFPFPSFFLIYLFIYFSVTLLL